ncbi:HDOD domain-containing protein [Andreprevotia chitinilytica]|uniref:HDOD domain-containing protein n=1 Tax=Andreprevotia chitinilytica TaxID=396808 RepID=UPI000557FAF4|nr:HDOD domain-containing protein [Andreprevotia chitinilytica]
MKLEDIFEQTHKLPTIPKVVQELIDSFSREDVDIESVARKISLDQVITAKVLRLANSAHFGASRLVGSVNEAVIVLGFNTVRTLVVASGVTGAFVATPGFDRKGFWQRSFKVASTAKHLARLARFNPEMAFVCGMIHNIGEMMIHIVAPEIAVKIDRYVESGGNRILLEDNNIGFDYVMVGEELTRRWNFPDEIQSAVKYQNNPQDQPTLTKLTAILYTALYLVDQEEDEINLSELPASILEALNATPEQIAERWETSKSEPSGLEEIVL